MKKMKTLAFIPARSGSKGLKDKNIKLLQGKPLIAYTIEAARESECFDEIMVSTDSEKYAEVAREYGASVPFLRSAEQSSDTANTLDSLREVLHNYAKMDIFFESVCILQPTSPLKTAADIKGAFELRDKTGAGSIVSVAPLEHPLAWTFPLGEDASLIGFAESEERKKRRQDLPQHYRLNGAIYLFSAEKIINPEFDFYEDDCRGYVMGAMSSIDIDGPDDFAFAEALLSK